MSDKKYKHYQVVYSEGIDQFNREVNRYLKEGYVLLGNFTLDKYRYYQALALPYDSSDEEDEDEEPKSSESNKN